MIDREFYGTREDGINLYRTYTDKNVYIHQEQTGAEYAIEAIDVENAPYTYTETDKPVEGEGASDIVQKAEAFDYLTGRSDGDE